MEVLKIAMFSWESLHSIKVGGLASVVSELSDAIVNQGHEVHIFTRRARNQSENEIINGVVYHRCFSSSFNPSGDILKYFDKMRDAMVKHFKSTEMALGKFDLVHFHDWHAINQSKNFKLLKAYPSIVTFHSTEWGRNGGVFRKTKIFSEISQREKYASDVADRLITVSKTMKNELKLLYKIPDWKIDVVPNGIVPERFKRNVDVDNIKSKYNISAPEHMILFIGRLTGQKGPDLLIGAIPKVLKNNPNAKLIIAGEGGMQERLKLMVKKLNLKNSVRVLGYTPQNEYLDLLNSCDLVCIPSRNEPFGLVLLEAWSAKKPVVATNVGGLSENIENFKNGITVNPLSDSISEGINYLLNDPSKMRKIGGEGYKMVETGFSWEAIAKTTLKSYEKILPSSS
jgi:glycosyltransferase involved in cell wall biosynthesis